MTERTTRDMEVVSTGKSAVKAHVLIITAPYYADIAEHLMAGATAEVAAQQSTFEAVSVEGALEIPQALGAAVDAGIIPRNAVGGAGRFDGVIALGCIIRGETSHYDVVVGQANNWLMQIAIDSGTPVGNAILTVDTKDQAMKRASGGRKGKGGDAARACLGLIGLRQSFEAGLR